MDDAYEYHRILKREIFAKSEEKSNWKKACAEWHLVEVTIDNDAECICTHPISYVYWIGNDLNGNSTHVGSTCIEQFEGNDELKKASEQAELEIKRNEKGLRIIKPCIVCGRRTKKLRTGEFIHVKCKRSSRNARDWISNKDQMSIALDQILRHVQCLSPYEQKFVDDMDKKQRSKGASDKQLAWLKVLAQKVKDMNDSEEDWKEEEGSEEGSDEYQEEVSDEDQDEEDS